MYFQHFRSLLRILTGVAVLLTGLTSGPGREAMADDKPASHGARSPDTRFVKLEKASIHCGPAQQHYATSSIARGDAVEVYHETKDGWCGIRPPKGSHDWLAAEDAYLLPGGKQAEVVGKKTPAWIGSESELKDGRFRWQIELQPSQKVEVIGELQQAIDSEKVRLWYKILPPPGEFRWIRSEALSKTPLKSRSETVTLASAHETADSTASATQVAAYQMAIDREPVPGEYIEGEGIVIGSMPDSMPEPWVEGNGEIVDPGYMADGSTGIDGEYIEGDFVDGQVVDGQVVNGMIVSDDPQPCPTCNQTGCTTCDVSSHQTDSFQQWDAVEAIGNPKLRFRPLGRILGLIGISVVEGERAQDAPGSCPIGCQCGRCIQSRADLSPRSSGRLNHLPRPGRRMPGGGMGDYFGMDDSASSSLGSAMATNGSPGRSLLETNRATAPWHALAPARLGTEIGLADSPQSVASMDDRSPSRNRGPVVAASAQGEDLHFSMPEIQQAMIELTRVVSESMERWELGNHAARAQQWIDQSTDPIARGEARLLLERIESFERLRRRSQSLPQTAYATSPSDGYLTSASMTGDSTNNGSVLASVAGYQRPIDATDALPSGPEIAPIGAAIARNPDGTPASDASGWLVQVYSAEFGQPEFALTDDHGGLIAYVQPSPGMNLSRYLKQPVGIYGVKGYLPNLNARQIVAERVVRLK